MEKKVKKYRFVGDPGDYNESERIEYKIYNKAVLKENTIPKNWDMTIKELVKESPKDWELIEEDKELVKEIETFKSNKKTFPKLSNELADKMLEKRLELIKQSLLVKAKEYVRNDDRIWNFNQAAIKSGKTREEALAGFRLKHEVSIDDIRNDIKGGNLPTKEVVQEKYGDVINYYILEEMSILHRIENEKNNSN
jgi:hypothetical protein